MSANTTNRAPGLVDVAGLAGVSHQTVSRVINGHPNVREQTRIRVNAAIAQLGYRPNFAAKALASGRSNAIGIVTQNTTLYGPASLLAAFEQHAAEAGFTVNVASVRSLDRQTLLEAVERHLNQRVDGIVIIAPVVTAGEAIASIPSHVPMVAIDGDPQRSTSLVTVDQREGGRLATQCLLDAGHDTVWHVSGPSDWFDRAGRVLGWEDALRAAGADIPPLLRGDWSAASGYESGQMLARIKGLTAVFATNDHVALGVLRALYERGIRVPQDVSVVGFDDVPEAAFFIPPLTTVRPDFDEVARRTLAALQSQLNDDGDAAAKEVVAPVLVERGSVAHPIQ